MKNKTQKAAEGRAAKKATPEVETAVEQPKAEATVPAVATTLGASKQDATIAKLKEGWTAKGVNLDKMQIKDDGKFKLLVVAEGWPTVQVGNSGGVVVLELRSYQCSGFDAALDGLARYEKQNVRDAKKASAAAPATPAPKAAAAEAVTA